jgi:nanoRNase/pAp phosphatase (c-di-AMP/oligoRNAs hydrolase)
MLVADIAIEYGGGGHQRASGCTIYQTMDQTIDEVVNNTKKRMETVNY